MTFIRVAKRDGKWCLFGRHSEAKGGGWKKRPFRKFNTYQGAMNSLSARFKSTRYPNGSA